ncbi:MAG: hypothetical protein KDM81_19635, partial [Verrucomicrobiae bacterium]|nr:hypothetical protein [Verrucomicrobiae bacterium]
PAVRSADGLLYAFGGATAPWDRCSSTLSYDPATDTWERKSNMPTSWVEEYDPAAGVTRRTTRLFPRAKGGTGMGRDQRRVGPRRAVRRIT